MVEPTRHGRVAAEPSSRQAIIDMTRTGTVSSWNPAAAALYGYPAEEIVGCAAEVLFPPEGRAEEAAVLRRITTDGRAEQYEADRLRKDGTVVTVSLTAAPIIGPADAIVGVTTVSRKVGGPRAVQDQVQEAIDGERRDARELLDVSTDSQRQDARSAEERFNVRADTQRQDARSAEERFDVKVDAQRRDARNAQDRFDVEIGAERLAAQERFDVRADTQRRDARVAQDRFDVQIGAERRDLREAQDEADAAIDGDRRDARDAQDQADAAIDSERRDAQERFDARRDGERREVLEQNEELQVQLRRVQRLDSLGQLAGGVAHDFNNLLAVILSYASFVSQRLDSAAETDGAESWAAARSDMAHIEQAVEGSANLTRQLLAFASREPIRPLTLDLNAVIADVEELLRRAIGEHIELVTSLSDGLWPILADAGKLEQVLVNLAVNARDAMPAGGTLTIGTENITVEADSAAGEWQPRPGRNVRLRVTDTGTGMTADVIDRAFEPFFTTKVGSRGTGLGLATVYGIVAQAEARIEITSEPGTGTTFTIVLPVTDEVAAPAEESAPSDWEPQGETVLLVEDEDDLREVTGRIFTSGGYHVISAANGPAALDIARSHEGEIHLLVTDVVMPRMLGREVADRMRMIKPDVDVLYMSGYAEPVLASQGRLDRNLVFVEKPFSDAELLAKAGQVLSGHLLGRTH